MTQLNSEAIDFGATSELCKPIQNLMSIKLKRGTS